MKGRQAFVSVRMKTMQLLSVPVQKVCCVTLKKNIHPSMVHPSIHPSVLFISSCIKSLFVYLSMCLLTCSCPSTRTPPGLMGCHAASPSPLPFIFPPWQAFHTPSLKVQLTQMCCHSSCGRDRGSCATCRSENAKVAVLTFYFLPFSFTASRVCNPGGQL